MEVVKWLGGYALLTSIFRGIHHAMNHVPVDWYYLGALLVVGIILICLASYFKRPVTHTSMIESGPSVDGLFIPIQVEAFQLSKEIRDFLKSVGPRPDSDWTSVVTSSRSNKHFRRDGKSKHLGRTNLSMDIE
jgi:hypothetical protein